MDDVLAKDFWDRVLSLCNSKGLRRTDLARLSGFGLGQLSTAIGRSSMPSAAKAVKIAEALSTTTEYLVTGKQPNRDPSLIEAMEDIWQSHKTRQIVLTLPTLTPAQEDTLLMVLRQMEGVVLPELDTSPQKHQA